MTPEQAEHALRDALQTSRNYQILYANEVTARMEWASKAQAAEARAEQAEAAIARIRKYINENFRFWCSPFGVAAQYAKALTEFIDRETRR